MAPQSGSDLSQTNSFICSESFQATERSFVPLEDILESERKAMEIVMNYRKAAFD
ncbi:hypothetical protein [Pseudothermotoga elfii]|uniref:hypothetical protein n=1 Tax=Pseudothermotoga elfii TaxID=38322 RepID=UPI00041A1C1A|nr:hypothetical protein [Pseudothermotoga elfii]